MLSAGPDVAIALSSYVTGTRVSMSTFQQVRKGLMRPHPKLKSSWKLMVAGKEKSLFFNGVGTAVAHSLGNTISNPCS